ncbi:MAG: membrane protein insertase YidC [Rickettsiaceae bacterium]|nr:membrane protein insertase YidC [Rickettsiaceae bacterium]
MENNNFTLILSVVLALGIIFGWQHFYEKPRLQELQKQTIAKNSQSKAVKSLNKSKSSGFLDTDKALTQSSRVLINTQKLRGSISLKALRFDDLTLVGYKETLDENSADIRLLNPSNTKNSYFAEFGFLGAKNFPNSETTWSANNTELTTEKPVVFSWKNTDGIEFLVTISVDENYMFSMHQEIVNHSNKKIEFQAYGLVNKINIPEANANAVVYTGMMGAFDGQIEEFAYDKIKSNKRKQLLDKQISWLGFTEKYWLTSFVLDKNFIYNSNASYALRNGLDYYQLDFVTKKQSLNKDEHFSLQHKLFLGAKKVDLLDQYEKNDDITLFDRAIDFGWFYILTKPLFGILNFFYGLVGNFGLSIIIVTVLVKIIMLGLANKSYTTMARMKEIQPEIDRLKILYANDQMQISQATLALYKKHGLNPVAGCLPVILQIPVFFSIYKVLNVTIEMRHASFFGWIRDLSAPDPTNIFNLFGLLPFQAPQFLHIGLLPILMALTMHWQQKLNPPPQDPIQQKLMQFMPLMFLFMFNNFPSGLFLYWTWSNILSIIQQKYVNNFKTKHGQ